MSDLRITIDNAGLANLHHGDDLIVTVDPEADGTIVIPLATLAGNDTLTAKLRHIAGKINAEKALEKLWEVAAEHAPTATKAYISWESEYDDEGGYYWSPQVTLSTDNDDIEFDPQATLSTDDDDIEFEWSIADRLYEAVCNTDPDFLPDGEYARP